MNQFMDEESEPELDEMMEYEWYAEGYEEDPWGLPWEVEQEEKPW